MSDAARRWVRRCAGYSLALCAFSCGADAVGTDTRTNWLMECDRTADCGSELACLCGVCTLACEDSAACEGLGAGAACFAVDGCRGVSSVCSTAEVEAARGNGRRDASANDAAPADAGVFTTGTDFARGDSGSSNAGSATDTEPSSDSSSGDSRSGDSNSGGSNISDASCSLSAADGGACGPVVVCATGDVQQTSEPCEVTGFVTRECVQGRWVDTCTSCQRVAFADAALEQAVRDGLSQPTGELSMTDAVALTTLLASNYGISDLRGIECLTGLGFVDLQQNQVSDVGPLALLPQLSDLMLTQNQVSSLAQLTTLSGLEELWISDNAVTDLGPLSQLTTLQVLTIGNNAISDLSPLSALTTLTSLDVSNNTFASIEPLSALVGLTSLTIGPNSTFDGVLSPVSGLTELDFLMLPSCGLDDSELAPLSGLTSLVILDLSSNDIVDVAAFSAFSVTTLQLTANPIDCDSEALATLEAQNFMTYTDCP